MVNIDHVHRAKAQRDFFLSLPAYQAILLIVCVYIVIKLILAFGESMAARRRKEDLSQGDRYGS